MKDPGGECEALVFEFFHFLFRIATLNMLQDPLCGVLTYRLGGVLRGYILLAADQQHGRVGREMEENGDMDDWCKIANITTTVSRDSILRS